MFVKLTILLLAALTGPALAFACRGMVPVVIGELAGGIVLGHTGFGAIDAGAEPYPEFRAIGFAMLMLTAGTHVDVGSPAIRRGFARGVLAFSMVGIAAVPVGLLLDHSVGVGHPALLIVLLAGSSAAIAFPIITERGLVGDDIAFLTAWIAIADSVTVVAMPLTLAASTNLGAAIGGDLAIIATGVLVVAVALRYRHVPAARRLRQLSLQRGWALQLQLSIILLIGLSAIAERTGASTLVAGFVAGMVIVRLREPGRLALQLTGVGNGFFVPIFFVLLGAALDLRALFSSPSRIVLTVALAAGAVATHVVASRVVAPGRRLATGLAASAQLGLPAAAAALGLTNGLLTPAEASAIVAAGCLTLIPATIGAQLLSGRSSARTAVPVGST